MSKFRMDAPPVVVVRSPGNRFYVSVRQKFVVATAFALGWFLVSLWLAQPWIQEFSAVVGPLLRLSDHLF